MTLKKLITLILILMMAFVTFGCQPEDEPDDNNDDPTNEEDPKDEEDPVEQELVYFDSGLSYDETLDDFRNPERGFYRALEGKLTDASSNPLWSEDMIQSFMEQFSFFHLRIGLEEFSVNAGGKSAPLSANALEGLRKSLDLFRKNDVSVIIRFSYNVKGLRNNNGYLNAEPTINLIEIHINQLGNILKDYDDIITVVETGMLGPWGEQHSTLLCTQAPENTMNYYRVVEAWMNVLPEHFLMSVRRPLYYMYWANTKYHLSLTPDNIGTFDPDQYPQYPNLLRLGVYNDGYLGSSSDLGTYQNRESEVNWLNRQAQVIPYGGEVVADNKTGDLGNYNNVSFLEQEAFRTHTTYLNYFWNYQHVVSLWEQRQYQGTNSLYYSQVTEYQYVSTHLGYRFVLRESQLANPDAKAKTLHLLGKIENVGFGNITNEKKTEIVLASDTDTFYLPASLDIRTLLSQTTTPYALEVTLPENLPAGTYQVYMKISDIHEKTSSAKRTIRFANSETQWNSEIGGNLLGEIMIG